MIDLRNWAGNHKYQAARLHKPATVFELREIVKGATKVKALGSRHSFNDIADTTEDLVSMDRFDAVGQVDRERSTVTVGGGITYGKLCRNLDSQGYALSNLASLPHISVVGACATGTHGSGFHVSCLSADVCALEIVAANGDIVTLDRAKDAAFPGAVVSLGGLGLVSSVTLNVVPSFQVKQNVYEWLGLDALEDHFEEVLAAAYSVSLFTDWKSDRFNQVWVKQRTVDGVADGGADAPSELFGAQPAPYRLHPIRSISAESCNEQLGIPGPWFERLPHFRLEFTPSVGSELQTEYLLPRSRAIEALRAVNAVREHVAPILQICEVRTVAADDLWLSPSYDRDTLAIHFTWFDKPREVDAILPKLEAALRPYDARPHWGKVFTTNARDLAALYPKMEDFRRLLSEYDPKGKFRNEFIDARIFGK